MSKKLLGMVFVALASVMVGSSYVAAEPENCAQCHSLYAPGCLVNDYGHKQEHGSWSWYVATPWHGANLACNTTCPDHHEVGSCQDSFAARNEIEKAVREEKPINAIVKRYNGILVYNENAKTLELRSCDKNNEHVAWLPITETQAVALAAE